MLTNSSDLYKRKRCRFSASSGCLLRFIPLLELINTSAGIDELLLAGKKRVALGADVYVQIRLDGCCFECLSTGTVYNGLAILGMNLVFHFYHLSQRRTRTLT